jgi:hypothetical protein
MVDRISTKNVVDYDLMERAFCLGAVARYGGNRELFISEGPSTKAT